MSNNPLVVACTRGKDSAVGMAFGQYTGLLIQREGLLVLATEPSHETPKHIPNFNNEFSRLADIARSEASEVFEKAKSEKGYCDYGVGVATGVIHHDIEPPGRKTPICLSLAVIVHGGTSYFGISSGFVAPPIVMANIENEEIRGLVDRVSDGRIKQDMLDSTAIVMALTGIVSPELYKLHA